MRYMVFVIDGESNTGTTDEMGPCEFAEKSTVPVRSDVKQAEVASRLPAGVARVEHLPDGLRLTLQWTDRASSSTQPMPERTSTEPNRHPNTPE